MAQRYNPYGRTSIGTPVKGGGTDWRKIGEKVTKPRVVSSDVSLEEAERQHREKWRKKPPEQQVEETRPESEPEVPMSKQIESGLGRAPYEVPHWSSMDTEEPQPSQPLGVPETGLEGTPRGKAMSAAMQEQLERLTPQSFRTATPQERKAWAKEYPEARDRLEENVRAAGTQARIDFDERESPVQRGDLPTQPQTVRPERAGGPQQWQSPGMAQRMEQFNEGAAARHEQALYGMRREGQGITGKTQEYKEGVGRQMKARERLLEDRRMEAQQRERQPAAEREDFLTVGNSLYNIREQTWVDKGTEQETRMFPPPGPNDPAMVKHQGAILQYDPTANKGKGAWIPKAQKQGETWYSAESGEVMFEKGGMNADDIPDSSVLGGENRTGGQTQETSGGGKELSKEQARKLLEQADGDRKKAEEIARSLGFNV